MGQFTTVPFWALGLSVKAVGWGALWADTAALTEPVLLVMAPHWHHGLLSTWIFPEHLLCARCFCCMWGSRVPRVEMP